MMLMLEAIFSGVSIGALTGFLAYWVFGQSPPIDSSELASDNHERKGVKAGRMRRSWPPKLCAKVLTAMLYVVAGACAAGAGVWAGSQASLPRPQHGTSHGRRVDVVAQPSVVSTDDVSARVRPPAGHAPTGSVEYSDDSFVPLGEQTSGMRAAGFADVFDRDGRLVGRYVVIEHSDGSWQRMQYLKLSAAAE